MLHSIKKTSTHTKKKVINYAKFLRYQKSFLSRQMIHYFIFKWNWCTANTTNTYNSNWILNII